MQAYQRFGKPARDFKVLAARSERLLSQPEHAAPAIDPGVFGISGRILALIGAGIPPALEGTALRSCVPQPLVDRVRCEILAQVAAGTIVPGGQRRKE